MRGTTTALYGVGPCVNPEMGLKVGSGSPGVGLNSKLLTRAAKNRKTVFFANGSPRQIRLPNNSF